MTEAERHALSVAFEARRAELRRYVEWCENNRPSWTDLTAEYRLRLDELDRLALSAQVGEMQHGCPADYLAGPGCTCEPVVVAK